MFTPSRTLFLTFVIVALAATEAAAAPGACVLEAGKGPFSTFTLEQTKENGEFKLSKLTATWKEGPMLEAVQAEGSKPIKSGDSEVVSLTPSDEGPRAFIGTAGEQPGKHEDQTVTLILTASEDDSGLAVLVEASSVGPIETSFYRCASK